MEKAKCIHTYIHMTYILHPFAMNNWHRDLKDFWSRSNQVPWGFRSQTGSDQRWKTFRVISLSVNWNLNSERQCGLHFRNKRNLWQTGRILIHLTTTIVEVQTRQALIYLSKFILVYEHIIWRTWKCYSTFSAPKVEWFLPPFFLFHPDWKSG